MAHLSRRDWLLLALITTLALVLRLYRLDDIPPGLHHDEALNGIEAHELLTTGARPIYIGSGFNGEPLLEYSIMFSEAVFGMTPFAVRLPSALYGALTIPIVFFLTREIGRWSLSVGNGKETARPISNFQSLVVAFILATLYWHLNASREGYKPVLLPLFGALAFLFILRTFLAAENKSQIAAGIVLGLGAYTYPSIRFLYPVVALFVLFVMWRDRAHWRGHLARALVVTLVALAVFAPLGIYYLQNPDAFFTRQNQVGVWVTHPNGVVGALAENSLKVAGMFFVSGDLNPRQNLPARPAFDWILSVGFLIGLAVALWRWKQPTNFLLLAWLAAMLVPSVVTEAAPNFLRSLGASVPAVILVVLGYHTLLAHAPRNTQYVLRGAYGVLLGISALLSLDAYFNQLPRDPRAWYAFDVGLVQIGDLVRALTADEPIYLTPFTTEQATIQFTLGEPRANFKWFDGRKCLVAPPSDHTATMLVVSEDTRTLEHLREYYATGQVAQQANDFAGKPYLSVFKVPAQSSSNLPRVPRRDVFGGQAMLLGYTFLAERVEAGQGVPLVLFWQAARPITSAYTVFAHLLVPPSARLWGQNDHPPCAGAYPTTRWDMGETFVEDFLVVVDKDAPAGSYEVAVGLYELSSGARLTLANGDDRVLLGPVEIFRK